MTMQIQDHRASQASKQDRESAATPREDGLIDLERVLWDEEYRREVIRSLRDSD